MGTFRLPQPAGTPTASLQYAIFSCSNWGFGYFNAYDLATRYDLDFWLHLGDFIYEYGDGSYPGPKDAVRYSPKAGSGLQPKTEIVVLDDYRTRFALYRADPALQVTVVVKSSHVICLWFYATSVLYACCLRWHACYYFHIP